MPHFVYLARNSANVIVSVIVSPYQLQQLPQIMQTESDADAYKRQLEAHYHIEPEKRGRRGKPVTNLTTQQTFKNAATAAASVGVSRSMMTKHLSDYSRYPNIKGYVFQLTEDAMKARNI